MYSTLIFFIYFFLNKNQQFSIHIANVNKISTPIGIFDDAALYSSWLSPKDAFNIWKCPISFNKYEKTATLVSNSQALIEPLDNMVRKAWSMFAARWVLLRDEVLPF